MSNIANNFKKIKHLIILKKVILNIVNGFFKKQYLIQLMVLKKFISNIINNF